MFFLSAALITGCGEDDSKSGYIARVDDSYLTQKDLTSATDSFSLQPAYKQEFVRNWIESELLCREAEDNGISSSDEYKTLLERSKKEILKTLFLKKYFEKNPVEIKAAELSSYFDSHKNEFRLFDESFLYNIVIFNDEEKAISFRNILMESDWNKTAHAFNRDAAVTYIVDNKLASLSETEYAGVSALLSELNPGEVSIVIDPEPKKFVVVQLVKKYRTDEIPEFEFIKPQIEERFLMIKRQQQYRAYIKGLYARHKVDLRF